MRNTWIGVVGTIGFLAITGTAVAATIPISSSGVGMSYGAAYDDAYSQAQGRCSAMGGTITQFEETSSGTVAGQWVFNGLALCQTP